MTAGLWWSTTEIERKFLARTPPHAWGVEILAGVSADIAQGYVTSPGVDPEVRLRRGREVVDTGGTGAASEQSATIYRLGFKARPADSDFQTARIELELEISRLQFVSAWRLTVGRRLRKRRTGYSLRLDESSLLDVAVDDFGGRLTGLRIAEIEFESLDAAASFTPAEWLDEEVTDDPRYRNASLAAASTPPAD